MPYGDLKTAPALELHGPYTQPAAGFVSIDQGGADAKPMIPITISPGPSREPSLLGGTLGTDPFGNLSQPGVGHQNLFISEFGAVGMSSFESMSATLAPEHWGLHGGLPADNCSYQECTTNDSTPWPGPNNNPMSLRNHPVDGMISAYFGGRNIGGANESVFKEQLWKSMIAQALQVKGMIETFRSKNVFGLLVSSWCFLDLSRCPTR